MKTRSGILLLGLCVLASCSHTDVAGGNATETTNGFKVSVVFANGKAAINARAALRPADFVRDNDTSVCQFATSDSHGIVQFNSIPVGNWMIEVVDSNQAFLLDWNLKTAGNIQNLGADTLRGYSRITGLIPLPFALGTRIELPGTDHVAFPDSTGLFLFDSIAAGTYVVQARSGEDTLRAYLSVGARSTANAGLLVKESATGILLDNFEDGNSRNRLSPLVGQGWWFRSNSAGVSMLPTMSPIPLDSTDSLHHWTIHFTATVDSGYSKVWANCGVQLGIQDSGYDLSHVDSLVFWGKGAGVLQVGFSLANAPSSSAHLQSDIHLDSNWARYAIPLDTMMTDSTKNRLLYLKSVKGIVWQFVNNGELWLDDISLVGASRKQIWGI